MNPSLDILRRNGFCVLEGIIPESEVGAVRESVASSVRKHTSLPLPQGYVTGFLRVNQSFAPYLAHPRIMALVDELFGEYPRISSLTGTINGPGIPRGAMHALQSAASKPYSCSVSGYHRQSRNHVDANRFHP